MAEQTVVADKSAAAVPSAERKREIYGELRERIAAVIEPEDDLLACMASIVCILHNALPYYYWTGFYRRVSADKLLVGPYQGTLGCLWIDLDRGVCGAAAREDRTMLVPDVHAFPGHIACDARSASEIVVPIHDAQDRVIAVLDVDSTVVAAFDETDAEHLEAIAEMLRGKQSLPLVSSELRG